MGELNDSAATPKITQRPEFHHEVNWVPPARSGRGQSGIAQGEFVIPPANSLYYGNPAVSPMSFAPFRPFPEIQSLAAVIPHDGSIPLPYTFDGIGKAAAPRADAAAETRQAPAAKSELEEKASKILTSPEKSSSDKLKAIEALSNAGVTKITLQDRDGPREYEIEKEKIDNHRSFVHLFAHDDKGEKQIVLRGISDGHGSFARERGADGEHVSLEGTNWSKEMAGRSVLAGQSPSSAEQTDDHSQSEPGRRRHHLTRQERSQRHEGERPSRQEEGGNEHHRAGQRERQKITPPIDNTQSGGRRLDAERSEDESGVEHASGPRSVSDWSQFFQSQSHGNNCASAAMAMMYNDWDKGPHHRDLNYFNHVAGISTTPHFNPKTGRMELTGYRGSPSDLAQQMESTIEGLHTNIIQSHSRTDIGDALDHEIEQGHTLIASIQSPYHPKTSNHYIYIAGSNKPGQYIIGDPGNRNGGRLGTTISRDELLNYIMNRHGDPLLVAGWTNAHTRAASVAGSAAARYNNSQYAGL